jgi:CRP/FNR family transcriptional regulator, cyclic AMP receptor protein
MGPRDAGRQSSSVDPVRSSPLLGRLTSELAADLLGAGRIVARRSDEPIRRAGDDAVALILEGVATRALRSREGPPVITDLLDGGAVSGLPLVLGQTDAGTELTALTAVDALLIPGLEVRRRVATYPEVALACLRTVAAEVAGLRVRETQFAYTSTAERIVSRLVELAERWGEPFDGAILIRVPITQEMLASWARSSREAAAKALHELRQARVIHTGRRELTILDLDRLRDRCGRDHRAAAAPMRSLLGAIT